MAEAAEAPVRHDELWEEEREVLSVDRLRELLARASRVPGVRTVVDALGDDAVGALRQALSRVLATDADRPIDKFGMDPVFYERVFPLARWVHDHWFRVETSGLEHLPDEGRVLVVANHSGTLPIDGIMAATTVRLHHPAQRHLRALVEDFVYHMPWLGRFMAMGGAVRACQENATALLEEDEAVIVFPEGVKGVGKLFRKRYRLQRFGRGGAIKLAMRTGSPIVPVAIVGAEEAMPLVAKVTVLAGPLGIPYIPVTPTLPLLGPLGLIPYPTKWFIDFCEPIDVARYGPDAVDDRVLVNRLNEELRAVIQARIDRRLRARKSVIFG